MRAVAVLVVLMLSGCARGGEPTPEAGGTVDLGGGIIVDATLAALNGTVVQSGGAPMAGARVSLVGTPSFMRTDVQGRFLFVNVTPGDLVLDVRADGFVRVERPVSLEAGALHTVHVVMVPDFSQAPGQAAHVHDLWNGATEFVLMDHDVDMTKRPTPDQGTPGYEQAAQMVVRPLTSTGGWGPVPIPDSERPPPIVLPGTKEIEVTLTWDITQVTKEAMGIGYISAAGGSMKLLDAQPSGQPWTIQVDPEMTDSGHQRFSFWWFHILYNAQEDPGLVLGPVHMKIVLKKGDVMPLDPPHEDFWQGQESLLVVEGQKTINADVADRTSMQWRPDQGVLVPPGTTHLWMEFKWAFHQTLEPVRHPDGYHAVWRPADKDRTRTALVDYHSAEPILDEDGRRVYFVEVEPEQTDQYYQRRSNWAWTFASPGEEDQTYDRGTPGRTTFELQVVALRGDAAIAASDGTL